MAKKYSDQLVSQIKAKQYTQLINDVNVLIKPIPDCDIAGRWILDYIPRVA